MRESIIQEIIMFRELKKEEIAEHREKLESLNDYLLLEELINSMRKSYYYEGYEDGYEKGYDDGSDDCDCGES
jgi:prophage maintenance system killer protein